MRRRSFHLLLSVLVGLLLLPATVLAENRNPNWGKGRRAANNRSNPTYRNGTWGNRNRTWGTRNPSLGTRGPWVYRNNGSPRNPNYRQGGPWAYGDHDWRRDRCVDPDHDGDCDLWHRHYRHRWYDDDDDGGHYRGWHNRGWGWHNSGWHGHDDDDDDGGWRNGRWNGGTPPGWHHGRKRGWGDSDLPPGLAKKQGW